MCICIFLHICIYTTHVPGAWESQRCIGYFVTGVTGSPEPPCMCCGYPIAWNTHIHKPPCVCCGYPVTGVTNSCEPPYLCQKLLCEGIRFFELLSHLWCLHSYYFKRISKLPAYGIVFNHGLTISELWN